MAKSEPTIDDIRSQRDALEKQLAAASIPHVQAVISTLSGSAADQIVADAIAASENLDETTRSRIAAWAKMRADMLTLLGFDLQRMQALVAPVESAPPTS